MGFFGTVTETEETAAFTVRLKVVNKKVTEVETLVVRQLDSGIKFEGQKFENKPAMNEILPAAQRLPRPRPSLRRVRAPEASPRSAGS